MTLQERGRELRRRIVGMVRTIRKMQDLLVQLEAIADLYELGVDPATIRSVRVPSRPSRLALCTLEDGTQVSLPRHKVERAMELQPERPVQQSGNNP